MHLRLIENKPAQPNASRAQMPFGWEMDGCGPKPVAEEQWVLLYARKMKEFGYTYKEIAQRLNYDSHAPRTEERWRAGDIVELLDHHDELLWLRWKKRKEKL